MERIYTIPVNEAFDASRDDPACGCPLCALYRKLEEDELDLILGGAMMEPDIRIKTNERGFCGTHADRLFAKKNRLGLALILESHLAEVGEKITAGRFSDLFGAPGEKIASRIGRQERSCYLCDRIEHNFSCMVSTTVLLFGEDEAFRAKLAKQPYFCLPHASRLLACGARELPKKQAAALTDAVMSCVRGYLASLSGDVSWFCKKFDYRYGEEPWYNAKDAVERAIRFLCGEER